MPLIQMELKQHLTADQVETLGAQAVDLVHAAIGSSKAHINVVIRHAGGTRVIEAGGVHERAS